METTTRNATSVFKLLPWYSLLLWSLVALFNSYRREHLYRYTLPFRPDVILRPYCHVGRTFNNLGEEIFSLVGCSGVLVPVGIKVRAKTQPSP